MFGTRTLVRQAREVGAEDCDFIIAEDALATKTDEASKSKEDLSALETDVFDDERALIEQAKRDADAFGQLYQRYVRRIYNYHYRHTGSVIEAEDLTSRTFYRALRSIKRYKDKGSFQAWLFRIAHNLVVNWYRDRSRRQIISLDVVDESLHTHRGDPQASLLETESQQVFARLLDELPEERKTLLILKFVEKMSNAEIAKVLGRTEGAIKSLYHRTLLGLRELVQEGEFDYGFT